MDSRTGNHPYRRRVLHGRLALGALIVGGAAAFVAWKLRPSPAAASFERGRQLAAVQMFSDARDAYQEAVKLDPRYAPPYRALAEMASTYGRPDISVHYWRKFLARDPTARHALCQLAREELQAGLEVPALQDAQEELRHDPRCARAHLIAGILYTRISDVKHALDHLRAAAQDYPDDPRVQLDYARVLSLSGDYGDAEPVLLHIVEKDRSHAEPYLWLGYVNGRGPATPASAQRAEQYLNMALDLQPDYPEANFEMARLLFGRREAAKALPYAQKAVSRRRHYPTALYLLARIDQALGRTRDAEQVLQDFQRESRLAEQEKALLKRYNLNRQDIDTALDLGRVEIARERPVEALVFLRGAASLAPRDARIHSALQQAEKLQGRTPSAAAPDSPMPLQESEP